MPVDEIRSSCSSSNLLRAVLTSVSEKRESSVTVLTSVHGFCDVSSTTHSTSVFRSDGSMSGCGLAYTTPITIVCSV